MLDKLAPAMGAGESLVRIQSGPIDSIRFSYTGEISFVAYYRLKEYDEFTVRVKPN